MISKKLTPGEALTIPDGNPAKTNLRSDPKKFARTSSELHDNAIELLFKPFAGILSSDALTCADAALLLFAVLDTESWTTQNNKEIHTENTSGWVILHSQINVFTDSEAEASGVRKALGWKGVFLDSQTAL